MKRIGKKKCVTLARKLARTTGVCCKCGAKKGNAQIHVAHIIPEEQHWTACYSLNLIELCASCHKWAKDSWHKDPLGNAKWFHRKFSGRYLKLLNYRHHQTIEHSYQGIIQPDWKAIYESLKLKIKLKRRKYDKKN